MTRHAYGAMWHIAGKSSVGIFCVSIPNILRIASCNFRNRKLRGLLTRACLSLLAFVFVVLCSLNGHVAPSNVQVQCNKC